jgi:Zn-finger nucleic acid-binding protein
MFVGSKFCGHCGAIAAPVGVSVDGDNSECPRCKVRLEILSIGETEFRGCTKCDGMWMTTAAFENVCAERERQAAIFSFLDKRGVRPQIMTKVNYVPCPDCGELMNRNNFARSSGVIVDVCRDHGVWFDADELPAIIEFIRAGGMERAREKEKMAIEEERTKIRDEMRQQGLTGRRLGISADTDPEEMLSIRSFVRSLFG